MLVFGLVVTAGRIVAPRGQGCEGGNGAPGVGGRLATGAESICDGHTRGPGDVRGVPVQRPRCSDPVASCSHVRRCEQPDVGPAETKPANERPLEVSSSRLHRGPSTPSNPTREPPVLQIPVDPAHRVC